MKHPRFSKGFGGLNADFMFPTALAPPVSPTALTEPLVPQSGLY